MKQTDFAERLTQAHKKGKYQAKQNRVYDFARVLRVDPAWLMGYDVPMEPQKQAVPQPTPIPPRFQPMPEMATVAIRKQPEVENGVVVSKAQYGLY